MIQINVVKEGQLWRGSLGRGASLGQGTLPVIRQVKETVKFRFCTASGTADTSVTAAMLNVARCSLVIRDKVLAITDSGYTAATDNDGVLAITFEKLVTDTHAVRTFLANEAGEGDAAGVICSLEFSSRNATTDNLFAIWFSIPVKLMNLTKTSDALEISPEAQNLYLTAAETRAAISEEFAKNACCIALENGTFAPQQSKIYTKTLAAGDTFAFSGTFLAAERATFELHLTQPATPVSFSWGNTILWMNEDEHFAAANNPPDFSTGNRIYALAFRFNGIRWLGNLAYTEDV